MSNGKPKGGIRGPIGMRRPFATCELKVVTVLEGRDRGLDVEAVDDAVEQATGTDVQTSVQGPMFEGDMEIAIVTNQSILLKDQIQDITAAVNSELINQNSSASVTDWRLEGT